MVTTTARGNKRGFIFWTPRILAVLFIGFIAIFALDVFSEDSTFSETIIALFVHLIPNYILIILLVISSKWPMIGGGLHIALGIGYIVMIWNNFEWGALIIAIALFVIGGLFIAQWATDRVKELRSQSITK